MKDEKDKKNNGTATVEATNEMKPASVPLANDRVPSLGAANPDDQVSPQELVHPSNGNSGWGNPEWPEWTDDTPARSYEQVRQFERNPGSVHDRKGVAGKDVKNTPSKKTVVASAAETKEDADHARTLADINERLARNREDEATLAKRRRRNALFSAIGDGVSALSNLYFTTKGSPSADQSKSMSKAVQERADKDLGVLERREQELLRMKERAIASHTTQMYKLQEARIRQQLADAQKAALEAKNDIARKAAEDKAKWYEKQLEILKKEKEAKEQREREKADQWINESKNRSYNRTRNTSNTIYNRNLNTSSQIANRNTPTTSVSTTTTTDAQGNEKTTTRTTTTQKGKVTGASKPKTNNKYSNTKALAEKTGL